MGRAVQAELLMESGADPLWSGSGWIALMVAAAAGHAECVELLARAGGVDWRDPNGRTPLMVAASGGWLGCVRELLRAGADPGLVDDGGRNALMFAARAGACEDRQVAEVVELLAQAVDLSATDGEGMNALMHAARFGQDRRVFAALLSMCPDEALWARDGRETGAAEHAREARWPEGERAVQEERCLREAAQLSRGAPLPEAGGKPARRL